MSAATANIVANRGAQIQFTFTPQSEGFASLAMVRLTTPGSDPQTPAIDNNSVTFQLPAGNSFLSIAILQGPAPETCNLTYTVDGGDPIDLFLAILTADAPDHITNFGK